MNRRQLLGLASAAAAVRWLHSEAALTTKAPTRLSLWNWACLLFLSVRPRNAFA